MANQSLRANRYLDPFAGCRYWFCLAWCLAHIALAGAELIGLAAALYFVNWKLEYRQVVTFQAASVKIEKGYFVPKRTWLWERDDTAVNVIEAKNQWEGPELWLHNKESRTTIGSSSTRKKPRIYSSDCVQITGSYLR